MDHVLTFTDKTTLRIFVSFLEAHDYKEKISWSDEVSCSVCVFLTSMELFDIGRQYQDAITS